MTRRQTSPKGPSPRGRRPRVVLVLLAVLALLVLFVAPGCDIDADLDTEPDAIGDTDAERGGPSGLAPADSLPQVALDPLPVEGPPAAPDTRGLDPDLLDAGYDLASTLPDLRSLLVARHGHRIREAYPGGASPARADNVKSTSKSILSTLVGLAIEEGHLEGLDQPIAPFFSRELEGRDDPRIQRITVSHLLSMQSGLESTSFGNYGGWVQSADWARDALSRPFVDEPGGRMLYSTGSSHLLSVLLTRATGESTLAFARRTLFRPMGIDLPPWTRDPQGIYMGGNEMALTPRDLLSWGELHRTGGLHQGERLVPERWIREAWTPRTTSAFNDRGYSLGWWHRMSGPYPVVFSRGYGGQYVFIVPALELVMVTTSRPDGPRNRSHDRAILQILDDYLVPAAEAGGPDPERTTAPSASTARSTSSSDISR